MPESISRLAPAKLNLALHVTSQRGDGYHFIDSLVAFTDFGDLVTVSPSPADDFVVNGHFAATVPIDGANLVVAARDLLRSQFPSETGSPVSITLEKRLPVSSGVGGGSSDAAAALKALVHYWDISIEEPDLAVIALGLGADLPMCLTARPLIARGIGNEIEPMDRFPAMAAVLVNAGVPVATPAVFAALRSRANAPMQNIGTALDAQGLHEFLLQCRNDLQEPAISLCPIIGDTLESLTGRGARFARMSGSGATCFGLFETADAAEGVAGMIAKAQPGWFVEACMILGTEGHENGRH